MSHGFATFATNSVKSVARVLGLICAKYLILAGGGCSRAKLVSDAGTGNFLKISGQNRLLARKK
jgi:hypothetical protein